MQIKKYSLLVLFGLSLTQTCLPMDANDQGPSDPSKAAISQEERKNDQLALLMQLLKNRQEDSTKIKILKSVEEIKEKMHRDEIFSDASLIDSLIENAPRKLKIIIERLCNPEVMHIRKKPVLLYGATGNGKTELCKAMALRLGFNYFTWTCNTGDRYQNSATCNMEEQLEAIEKMKVPCFVIFDEIDFLTSRMSNKQDSQRSAVGKFWTLLDAYKNNPYIFFICTTNNVDDIPDPLQRRFEKIQIKSPNYRQRLQIIKYCLEKYDEQTEFHLSWVTRQTADYCADSVKNIILEAIILSREKEQQKVTRFEIWQAIENLDLIEKTPWLKQIYKKIKPGTDGFQWLQFSTSSLIQVAGIGANIYFANRSNDHAMQAYDISKRSLANAHQSLEHAKEVFAFTQQSTEKAQEATQESLEIQKVQKRNSNIQTGLAVGKATVEVLGTAVKACPGCILS